MITRSDFFDALAKGALWDVGVAINRTNPLPLDKFSVFGAYSDNKDTDTTTALGYAKNSVIAYPGQIIAVVAGTDTEPVATVYVIKKTGTEAVLEPLGSSSDVNDLKTRLTTLETNAVTSVTGDKAVKATKTGNAVTLATQTSAVEGNILEIKDDGLYVPTPDKVTVSEYSIVKDESSSDYAAVYHLTKDNVNVGVAINIPKDKVVKSGTVERYTTGNLPAGVTEAGTYIVLVFENVADPCYINVKDLVDVYSGGKDSKGSGENVYSTIQVNVDDKNKITATVLDGAIHTAELADRAVTGAKIGLKAVTTENIANDAITATQIASGAVSTAKIADNAVTADKINDGEIGTNKLADGAVTKAKLHQEVKNSLDKADSAVQSVALESGTNNGTLKLTVDGTATDNIAVKGLGTAAYKADTAFDAAGAAAAVLGDSATDTAETATVHGVKKKAEANATEITALKNGKVDKITSGPADYDLIYGAKKTGDDDAFTDKWYIAGTSKFAAITTVAVYDDYSRLTTETPKADTDAANKKYVDDVVSTAVSSGVTVKTTGEGKYVTGVTKTNGKITVTKSTPVVAISEVTDLQDTLDAKATTEALNQAKADLSGEIISAKNELASEINKKQDELAFEGMPSSTNKVITKSAMDSAISTATAGLTGAMHYIGESSTNPTSESGATVTGVTVFAKGDVVTYQKKEFVYDGTAWRELGDEGSYAVKGSIKNADIAADAAIAQSKIDGLTTALNGKVSNARIFSKEEIGPSTINQALTIVDGKLDIPLATDTQFGATKVVLDQDNGFTYLNSSNTDYMERLSIYSVTTDILKNGTNTLILNGGGAAL